MKSFMRLGVAMLCTVMVVPAFAGFSPNGTAAVTFASEISGAFIVNQLVPSGSGSALKTTANGLDIATISDSNTYSKKVTGNFRVYRVDVGPTDITGNFSVTFGQNMFALVASNKLNLGGQQLPVDVLANFESEAAISPALGGNNIYGFEILPYGIPVFNPDSITFSGNVLTGSINKKSLSGVNNESFYALTAVPEPASLAIWGACSVGGIIAGRRRLRKQAA